MNDIEKKCKDEFDKRNALFVDLNVNIDELLLATVDELVQDNESKKIFDDIVTEIALSKTQNHPDYHMLAGRFKIYNLHRNTKDKFTDVITDLYNAVNVELNKKTQMISTFHYEIIINNSDQLNSAIDYKYDFDYDYIAVKTLEEKYLGKINNKCVERPQQMFMRTAIGIHGDDIQSAIETYKLLSEKYFIHSSNTLKFAAHPNACLTSSYILSIIEDSISAIFETASQCALITKYAGDIGLNVHNVRGKGTYIAGTCSLANGLLPVLRLFNNIALLAKTKETYTIYLEPWHCDIFQFLSLKNSTGKYEMHAADLNYALWIPDLFMQRVESNSEWTLMCPNKCQGLTEVWGMEFDKLYKKYEMDTEKIIRKISARQLWTTIIESQIETGQPYLLYKDTCNRKSNQQNLGTIKNGNHKTDSVQYSANDEIAACTQASISLNKFINITNNQFDFVYLKTITKIVTRNLNKIIDINQHPSERCCLSNLRNRSIGIGVQGLADAFILMRLPYESEEAQLLNQQIFETIYYAALEASCELAKEYGSPYETYTGCPISNGHLQFDMWNKKPTSLWDWNCLKQKISEYGLRNSLLISIMSTDYVTDIFNINCSFEPLHSNVKNIKTINSIESKYINQYLVKDLIKLDLWNENMKQMIFNGNGSIQSIDEIPHSIKQLYKIISEISLKTQIKMSADRGPFIDQSQSFNIYLNEQNCDKLTSIHFSIWKLGQKTGMTFLKTC